LRIGQSVAKAMAFARYRLKRKAPRGNETGLRAQSVAKARAGFGPFSARKTAPVA